ncbi:MAG: hypothetical protein A2X61_02545 [Ignavibacteria bacterium GWB2_35_12]|nr:MAG: hypothetical protein A2X63_11405 [Ignavibacteria bacterium GWA2_35_8]OGU42457.1 MAG: hypothetical protein A2X61_02545 [Ignavibacteria bacterium GWB2_35_12]OGU96626.1 MAG: hypothetical protein A2220_12125 [Ignavibacteria bacterium RIFOXYA2_FULL_35_10]OGV24237.1 MAG: hypothetical protein A2475_08470 [Ignavibacteria bacterium RIFOXYC2_FULL_35_21]
MKSNPIKYKILLVFFFMFCCIVNLYSKEEKPKPPSNFIVTNPSGNYGLFKWKVTSGGASIDGFKIYYANGETEEISEFQLLKTVNRNDSLKKDNEGYHFVNVYLKNKGKYSFFITAYNQYGESERSNIVFQTIGENPPRIEFTSNPDTVGFVGENYYYDANAVASNGDMLKYEIAEAPDGMSIIHTNGELNWLPTEKGVYKVIIKAISINHPNLFNLKLWYINVKSCKRHTTLSGIIEYPGGEFVESGLVKVYKQIGAPQNEPVLLSTFQFTNGEFSMDVDEGVYLLRFEGEKIIPEWYEDAYLLAEAKRIEVKCGDEIKVEAKVDKYIPIETYKLSGKVTRESDGAPVPFVPVHFVGRNNQSEETKKGMITDEEGNYEIRLEGNSNYIATVSSWQNYLAQFYDKADNTSEATIIELNSNREHIDFVLKEKPTFSNKLSGVVKDNEGNKIKEINVIAFRVSPDTMQNMRYVSRNAVTDNSGNFKFESLLTGKYILMVFTSSNSRKIPGYYLLNNPVIRTWRDATKIEIGDTTIKEEIFIKVPNLPVHESGRGIISGVITQGETFMVSSQVLKEGDPIAGALVFALDQNSNVRNFTFTDDLGRYEMRSMKAGKYKIFADKVGYYTYNTNVELIDDNSTVNNNVELYTIIGAVTNGEPLKIELYPNPVSDILYISFKDIPNKIKISIFNSLGEKLSSNLFDANDSLNGINLNVSNYITGFYYLRIESGLNSGVHPFVISR